MTWIGQLQPTPASETYTVKIVYRLSQRAIVTILHPPLEAPDERRIPHVFEGNKLCLHHDHERNGSLLLAETVVPWTSEWLLFYEFWKATCWRRCCLHMGRQWSVCMSRQDVHGLWVERMSMLTR